MAAGGVSGAPPTTGRIAEGDQRATGRRFFESRKGFSPGIVEGDPDERAWLKYVRDVGQGFEATPPKGGFHHVTRHR